MRRNGIVNARRSKTQLGLGASAVPTTLFLCVRKQHSELKSKIFNEANSVPTNCRKKYHASRVGDLRVTFLTRRINALMRAVRLGPFQNLNTPRRPKRVRTSGRASVEKRDSRVGIRTPLPHVAAERVGNFARRAAPYTFSKSFLCALPSCLLGWGTRSGHAK